MTSSSASRSYFGSVWKPNGVVVATRINNLGQIQIVCATPVTPRQSHQHPRLTV